MEPLGPLPSVFILNLYFSCSLHLSFHYCIAKNLLLIKVKSIMICLLASYGYSNLESSRSEPVSQTLVHRLCLWPVQKYNPSLCKKELNSQSCNRNVANKSFAMNCHSPRSIAWILSSTVTWPSGIMIVDLVILLLIACVDLAYSKQEVCCTWWVLTKSLQKQSLQIMAASRDRACELCHSHHLQLSAPTQCRNEEAANMWHQCRYNQMH